MSNYDIRIRDDVERKIMATIISFSHTEDVRNLFINKKLKSNYFNNPFHQEVFRICDNIYARGLIPTVENIALSRGEKYKSSLVEGTNDQETYFDFKMDLVLLSGQYVPYVEFETNIYIMKEFVIMDYWNSTSDNLLNSYWHNRDVLVVSDNIVNGYNQLLEELSAEGVKVDDVNGSVEDLIEVARKKHERFKSGIDTTIKTGHSDLDYHLGGFAENELIVIGGRPGMGKTAFALGIAKYNSFNHQKEMKRGIYFTLEMTKEQLMMKYASPVLGIPYTQLKSYRLTDEQFNSLINYFQYLESQVPLDIVFENRLENIISITLERKPQYVIVDYLQLVKQSKSHQSREQEVAYISKSLKELSIKASCPVFALSQLKRIDGIPKLSDLRESGSLEQDADTVIFPYRPSYNNSNNSYEQGNTDVLVPKCRSSGPGSFSGYFDLQSFTLYNEKVITKDDYLRLTNRL